jgi:hypothetical protein
MASLNIDVRQEMLALLLQKIREDEYPSTTMMDLAEQLLEREELAIYAAVLMEKIKADEYPSIPMMQRVLGLI